MKVTLTVIAFFIAVVCFANMASPYMRGSNNVAPITSRNIDIIRELLVITPSKDFETADFCIDYFINTDTSGLQVPLLFVAAQYRDSMTITIDGKPVQSQNLLLSRKLGQGKLAFHNFDTQFDTTGSRQNIKIAWDNSSNRYYNLAELEYFEANISKGQHAIHVQYTAKIEIDRSGWLKKYNCKYYLSPARHWKSFGMLDVVLVNKACNKSLSTNLGKPSLADSSVAFWHFKTIPQDILQISWLPHAPPLATALIAISPTGLAIIISIILMVLHLWIMLKYKRNKNIYKTVYYTGIIAVPIIFYACYFSAFYMIDAAIGNEASKFHGYIFLYALTYVLAAPAYAGVLYPISNAIKRKTAAQKANTTT